MKINFTEIMRKIECPHKIKKGGKYEKIIRRKASRIIS
jgi:hypothetical protein